MGELAADEGCDGGHLLGDDDAGRGRRDVEDALEGRAEAEAADEDALAARCCVGAGGRELRGEAAEVALRLEGRVGEEDDVAREDLDAVAVGAEGEAAVEGPDGAGAGRRHDGGGEGPRGEEGPTLACGGAPSA